MNYNENVYHLNLINYTIMLITKWPVIIFNRFLVNKITLKRKVPSYPNLAETFKTNSRLF